MDELHERMLEDLYTLIGFENAGREELCFSCDLPRKGTPIHPAVGIDRRHAHNRRGNRRRSVSPAGRRAGGRAASSKPD